VFWVTIIADESNKFGSVVCELFGEIFTSSNPLSQLQKAVTAINK
jgi:hypothetical protein